MKHFLSKFLQESDIATKGKTARKFEAVPRMVLVLILAVLVALILISLTMDKARPQETDPLSAKPVEIVVATDLHFLAAGLHDDGAAYKKITLEGDGKNILRMDEMLDAFSSVLQKDKADMLLLTGDLTLNGEKESHLALAKRL